MEIHEVTYAIREEDFPRFADIRAIEDGRSRYFTDDYRREKDSKRYQARCTNHEYVSDDYWVEELERIFPSIAFTLEKVVWGGESVMTVTSEGLLTEDKIAEIYAAMEEQYQKFAEIITIDFDLSLNPSYKSAVELNAVDIFENWLYGNVFCQTPEHCDYSYNVHSNKGDGVYSMTFTIDVDEYTVRKFVDEFIEEEMMGWIEQDLKERNNV